MCSYYVNEDTSPLFVMYNLVFDTPRGEAISANSVIQELSEFGKLLDRSVVEDSLSQWYRDGRLNRRGNEYVVA